MNELTPTRDIQTITLEIQTLHAQAQQIVLGYAIEIGRRLKEAKEQLKHGEWGPWLKTKVNFSQSKANSLMRIFEAYGAAQLSFFGDTAKSQTLGNLTVSKALSLLALPEDEREEFAITHRVEELSSRELDRMIRERDEAKAETERKEKERIKTQEANEKMAADMCLANTRLHALNEEVTAAEARRFELEQELTTLKNKPVEVAVTIDQDAVREAVEAAKAENESKLKKAKEQAASLKAEVEALKKQQAKNTTAESEQIEALKKQLALSEPDVQTFKLLFIQAQETINQMLEALANLQAQNNPNAPKLKAAAMALIKTVAQSIQ